MGMTASVRMGLAILACGILSACAGTTEGDGDCVSNYDSVASSPTWEGLKDAMLGYKESGRVVSVRTLADAWFKSMSGVPTRGAWRAGVWNQCID